MTKITGLVQELGASLGLETLSFTEGGVAGIEFDDLPLNFFADDEAGELTLFLDLGDVPENPADQREAYAYLLKNNNFARNTGGGVLGIDENERTAYFSHRFKADSLDLAQLGQIVEAFLELAEMFRNGFRDAGRKEELPEPSSENFGGIRV